MMIGRETCDHDYEAAYCERCGKYAGQVCNACGHWHDGGDYMATRRSGNCDCIEGPVIFAEEEDDDA